MRKIIDLPLHHGETPPWLFDRMTKLASSIIELMVIEFGTEEVLKRLSDPLWFQAFGCILGFDWHSSGVTTTTMGAVKYGLQGKEREIGIYVCGGKGKVALKTPDEIRSKGIHPDTMIKVSRLTSKVDSSLIQDSYDLYHHTIIYDVKGNWAVVQQGMNQKTKYARRYHWLSFELKSFHIEPHKAIVSQSKEKWVLNLVAKESEPVQHTLVSLIKDEDPWKIYLEYKRILYYGKLPKSHPFNENLLSPENLQKALLTTYKETPQKFEEILEVKGLGPKFFRALALISDLVYGVKPSYNDPALYSFAHGGKDGYPYPIDKKIYDKSIDVVEKAIKLAKIGEREKIDALRKLNYLFYT